MEKNITHDDVIKWCANNKCIALFWNIEDVKSLRVDEDEQSLLTDEQAYEVLCNIYKDHDSEYGVSWETLENEISTLYPTI